MYDFYKLNFYYHFNFVTSVYAKNSSIWDRIPVTVLVTLTLVRSSNLEQAVNSQRMKRYWKKISICDSPLKYNFNYVSFITLSVNQKAAI